MYSNRSEVLHARNLNLIQIIKVKCKYKKTHFTFNHSGTQSGYSIFHLLINKLYINVYTVLFPSALIKEYQKLIDFVNPHNIFVLFLFIFLCHFYLSKRHFEVVKKYTVLHKFAHQIPIAFPKCIVSQRNSMKNIRLWHIVLDFGNNLANNSKNMIGI